MNFLSLNDKLEDFKSSYSFGDKLKNGGKIFGTVLANTAIAAGKVATAVAEKLPEQIEKQKNKR